VIKTYVRLGLGVGIVASIAYEEEEDRDLVALDGAHLFPESVTPNHHKLAKQFVLFDNLYCDGEVSVDGHSWSNSAWATATRSG